MNIRNQIVEFLSQEILFDDRARSLALDDPLIGPNGIVDSFGLNQLILFIEERLNIRVDDLEVVPENFATLSALCAFIDNKLGDNRT